MNEIARIADEIRAEVQLTVDAHPEALGREYVHGIETALRQMEERSAAAVPIVWDGSDEALEAIRAALPSQLGVERCSLYELGIYRDRRAVGRLVPNSRVRIEGDSFVILPPEVKL